jgi:inhibitor of cysteine peptidase
MKKMILITVTLLMTLSLFTGCGVIGSLKPGGSTAEAGQAETTADAETPAIKPDGDNGVVTIKTENYDYMSDYIDVKLEVPQLTGLSDSAAQDSINKIFSDIMTEAKDDVKAAEEESKRVAEKYDSAAPYMTYISYSEPYNRDGILSILMSNYTYSGGAHGNDIWNSYTFDLKTGKMLSLGDLMAGDSGYNAFINSTIRTEIDRRAGLDELMENAEFKDIGDDPAYYLTSDAIVFYFQEYEYFPYAAGIQEFPVKYADLSGMLKKEYATLMIIPVVLDNTAENSLSAGDIGQVSLSGNPTTGYSWHYTISDTSVLDASGNQYQTDAPEGIDGAGGTYIFDFRALKPGTATITFKYYRDWLDESDAAAEDNVTYSVTVK